MMLRATSGLEGGREGGGRGSGVQQTNDATALGQGTA